MAIGVANGAKALNLKLGTDVITGGVDWANEGIEAVRKGDIEASLGGHVMEAGWAAVLLYDYFHNQDFAAESVSMQDAMTAVTRENIDAFYTKFTRENWHLIDFKNFSKAYNPDLHKYDFSLRAVMNELEAH
jgi:ABC-type sugar transport system substrate-binding protein